MPLHFHNKWLAVVFSYSNLQTSTEVNMIAALLLPRSTTDLSVGTRYVIISGRNTTTIYSLNCIHFVIFTISNQENFDFNRTNYCGPLPGCTRHLTSNIT